MKKYIWLVLILISIFKSTEAFPQSNQDIFFGAGYSYGLRNGQVPRSGPSLNILYGNGHAGETSRGNGLVLGVASFKHKEYFVGPSFFQNAYFFLLYGEAAVHFRESKIIGARATLSAGLFLMPFVSIGADIEHSRPQIEVGISFWIPFLS